MDHLLNRLKEKKLKITEDRKEVLSALQSAGTPLTIAEIHDKASRAHPSLNLTTVYRAMDTLEEVGLIHKLNFGENKYVYELVAADSHHHHLICTNCKKVIDLDQSFQESFLEKIAKENDFVISAHTFEIYGLCADCRKKIEISD